MVRGGVKEITLEWCGFSKKMMIDDYAFPVIDLLITPSMASVISVSVGLPENIVIHKRMRFEQDSLISTLYVFREVI